ncbi:MAG TPA: DHA2 family efflux MFS transporter permease subunit [Deltaproteobacteria bacterium]|nr:DHA2 family efflux MFS transporter permease subunit [Deltaproteobacteria bacterium]HXK46686.1 DHA2 family efflux MFS transporter permease subunit [Deltaproteobacteria bacterium]
MSQRSTLDTWMIILTVMTGSIMSALDTSIVNVALPHMQGAFGASVEEIAWVSTGYILSCVIVMPLIAFLSSRFGRKNFYLFSIVLFTVSSMLCGIARDLPSMVIFRILQGMGGGTLVPVAQAILRETLPPQDRGKAMGIYGFGVILGPAVGPTLGGWLTDQYSWPWIFYINVPIGILNTLLVMRYIEDPPHLVREKGRMDITGLLFMIVGLGALQIMLEKGQRRDWFTSDFIVWLAVVACIGLAAFVRQELKTDRPAVNLRILKNINFTLTTVLGGILGLCLYGSLFIMPLFLQHLLGHPAYESGLAMLPRAMLMAFSMLIAGKIYVWIGPRLMIMIGLTVNAMSFFMFSRFSLDVGYWDLFLPQCLQGLGFGFIFVAVSAAALSGIEMKLMTAATGLYNVVRQVFGSFGIALCGTLLTHGESWNRAALMWHVSALNESTVESQQMISSFLVFQGGDPATADQGALRILEGIVMQQASMLSFNHVFFTLAVLFMLSMPLVILIKDPRLMAMKNSGTAGSG